MLEFSWKQVNPMNRGYRNFLTIISVSLLLLFPLSAVEAQTINEPRIVKSGSNSCELNSLYLDSLAQDARPSNERVFVIARRGGKESSKYISRRRLELARLHLVVATDRFSSDRIVFAEGDTVNGEGRLEFYLGSKLYLISLAQRDKNICFTCCDDPPTSTKKNRRKRS